MSVSLNNILPDIYREYHLRKGNLKELKYFACRLFKPPPSNEEIEEKAKGCNIVVLVLSDSNDTKIGFSVVRVFRNYALIWLFGILPTWQNKGLGKLLLRKTEEYVLSKGINGIFFSTYNCYAKMLMLGIKEGYKIISVSKGKYGDGRKIKLWKRIITTSGNGRSAFAKKEVRFLLSNKCNYNCFFCHMEGLDATTSYHKVEDKRFLRLLKQVVISGYNDVTFSGGEPLLEKDILRKAIRVCNSIVPPPKLTIVTNGSLWTDDLIEWMVRYSGDLKVNFSIHSFDKKIYHKITGSGNFYDMVLQNLRYMVARNIKVKLNCVVLKNINDGEKDIYSYIVKAQEIGVWGVKFLELLATPEKIEQYKYFVSAASISITLQKLGFQEWHRTPRIVHYRNNDLPGLNVEVLQCACKLGCNKCNLVRDRTFGPDAKYYPCFVQSRDGLCLGAGENIASLFNKGDRIISNHAIKYGNDSPILIAQDKFLKERLEVFFETNMNYKTCSSILATNGFKVVKIKNFTLYYCMPIRPSTEWKKYSKILKFGYEEHTSNKVEFIFSNNFYYKKDGFLLSEQVFIDDSPPPSCHSVAQAKKIISALDFIIFFTKRFQIHYYSNGHITLSIDMSSKRVNVKFNYDDVHSTSANEIIKVLKLKPIMIPFTKWLIKINS